MKVKLTKKFIDSVDYTAKGTEIYMDDVLTGFALRVGKQSKRYTEPPRLYRRVDCLSQAALSDSQRLS